MTRTSRVAVVTDEFAGLNKGGGIGTCANTLAQSLQDSGFAVDIIMTDPNYKSKDDYYNGLRVINVMTEAESISYEANDCVKRSYAVYQMLIQDDYEAVHFNDWKGSGHFYALAKRQGFVDAKIVTHLHGPSKWARAYNLTLLDIDASELEALEFSQVENSDLVLSPSQYLIDWYRDNGIKLPHADVINWQLPEWKTKTFVGGGGCLRTRAIEAGEIKDLIFFGRHEKRKGFVEFLEAVASRPNLRSVNLIFLGRFDHIDREFTGSMVNRILSRHAGSISFLNDFGHYEATEFLKTKSNALVVMPSLIENSPCTVGECFTIGIPFVATSVGGTPELVRNGSNSPNLCGSSVSELGAKLEDVVVNGLDSVESVLNPSEIAARWASLHTVINRRDAPRAVSDRPRVSVCLIHHNRTRLLRRALSALSKQTYDNFEVVLVDDGSDESSREDLSRIERESWNFALKVILSQNRYLGAARNLAVEHATGEFLIFHDDDNVSEPHQIENFIKAALNGNYDVVTCQYLVFDDDAGPENATLRYFPIGSGGPFSWLRNRFGDANALVRKSTFEAVGGFSELKNVGWEDWEFFLRCFVHGARHGFVPIPLFRYRTSPDGMLATSNVAKNHKRIIDLAHELKTRLPAEILEFCVVHSKNEEALARTWHRLGKIEHAELHRELMSLVPNSDAAREKFMELNFAMGRYSDAVALGLHLRDGYHRVGRILEAFLPRLQSLGRIACFEADLKVLDGQVALLVGWIDFRKQRLAPRSFTISDQDYRVDIVRYRSRRDVNDFFGRSDSIDRGFEIIGSSGGPRLWSETLADDVEIARSNEPNFEIALETADKNLAPVSLQCSGVPDQTLPRAFLERIVEGHTCYLDVGDAGGPWLNRLQIAAELPCTAYILHQDGSGMNEVVFDDRGNASLKLLNIDKTVVSLSDIRDVRLFVASGSGSVQIALSPIL